MNFDFEAAGLDPNKLVTRAQLAALVREKTGIPMVESRIDKDAMVGRGPKVTALYGKVHLILLGTDLPTRSPRPGRSRRDPYHQPN
jgi:hypothetical protein